MHNRGFLNLVLKETAQWINSQYKKKKRTCPCGCNTIFTPSSSAHFFYSRSCYSRYHRIPGMIRRILKGGMD